ncbi:hypothetical protein [Actinomadura sp. DC4]|uniref:hypothetical protein n=1 Tax=Actinomadura sp. DC4 TaxID=3055069 RepID=UPI0025B261DF|nr:hypothetical protein [Actinomadura sp. DC4]MDN3359644.1 hypothetical protein [Actinomadura sp. DC4]
MHARLEEMRFRRGMFLMVTTGAVIVAAVAGVTMLLTGGKGKTPADPVADPSSSASSPASAKPKRGSSLSPRRAERPRTSSSTMVGVPLTPPPDTSRPRSTASTTPTPPPWWPRDHHWHGTPPPWWHHH